MEPFNVIEFAAGMVVGLAIGLPIVVWLVNWLFMKTWRPPW